MDLVGIRVVDFEIVKVTIVVVRVRVIIDNIFAFPASVFVYFP